MKPEQKFWRNTLRPALIRIPGLEYERIELRTGASGMPDVVYTFGATGWIENKWHRKMPGLDLSGWSVAQRAWAKTHVRAGATVFLCVASPGRAALLQVNEALCDLQEVELCGPWVREVFEGRICPKRLAKVLHIGPEGNPRLLQFHT